MPRTTRVICQCGGEIPRRLPSHCPHCGRRIVGVSHRYPGRLMGLLVIGLIFAALVAAMIYLARL